MDIEKKPSRLIVLGIDRDDDVGIKAKAKTPIMGRDDCLAVAIKLVMADPEEADANAIFAAVKQYDELVNKGYECEVAVIAGLHEGGIEADQKLRKELIDVISKFDAKGAVLVSDGFEDREALPVLMSTIPVLSIKRVIIKHSRSVEESYAIFWRYLRMLVTERRYSKFSLGIPGLLLLTMGLLNLFNLVQLATQIIFIILGIALITWGFDLTKHATFLRRMRMSSYIRLFSTITTLLIISVAFFQSFVGVSKMPEYGEIVTDPSLIFRHGPLLLGSFIRDSLLLTWIGLLIYLASSMALHWVRKSVRVWRDLFALVILVFLYIPLQEFSRILINPTQSPFTLISQLLLGLMITFIVVSMAYNYIQSHKKVERVE
ncbi:MAG: DUF373 family protein [Nitrososphaerales archaeon]